MRLAQAGALQDWHLFVSRLQRIAADPAVRLSVHTDVLVLTGAPLFPATIGDSMPLVLAMRMLRLADSSSDGLDRVVPAAALADRFARVDSHPAKGTAPGAGGAADPNGEAVAAAEIPLPPAEVPVAWTARTPPRAGWEYVTDVDTQVLTTASASGIAEIAEGTPEGAGAHAVTALRRSVWSRSLPVGADTVVSIPAGAAFAMDRMGFLHRSAVNPDEAPVRLFSSGKWLRLSSPVGHVLSLAGGSHGAGFA